MILKYLKDQGGQFWGAFSKSLGETVSAERDRPLKEAMMKAQIAHQQAVADKAQMDIQQAQQQQQAVTDLAAILQPKPTTPAISEAPAPVPMAPSGNIPTLTPQMTTPDMKSPEVMSKLAKAQPKEFTTAVMKQAINPAMAGGAIVNTWEEARHLQNDPEFQAANPYGGRWQVNAKGQIQFQGIHPVNPEAAIFHGAGGQQGAIDYAYNRGASAAAGGTEGKAAQQIGQPIQPRVPFAGQPGQPNVGTSAQQPTTNAPAPGGSSYAQSQKLQKTIAREEAPLPEGLAKQQRDYTTLLNTTIADIENNFDPSFLGKRGLPGAQAYRESFLAPALEGVTGVSPSGEKEVIFRKALADAQDMLLRARSGAQINEQEAKRLAKLLPQATDNETAFRAGFARFKHQVEASISNGKLYGNVSRSQLNTMGPGEKNPTPTGGGSEEIIHHPSGDYVVRGGSVFKVK